MKWLNLLKANTRKEYIELKRYLPNTIALLLTFYIIFLAMFTTGQWLNIDVITLLPILILTLFSMFGLGFIIAGMSVIFKQVQAFLQILQFILAGLVFVPVSVAPILAFFPIVKGVDLVRNVMIDGATLNQIAAGDYLILIFNAVFYFAIGLMFYLSCEKIAMKKGLLAHY